MGEGGGGSVFGEGYGRLRFEGGNGLRFWVERRERGVRFWGRLEGGWLG
ncbi:uncharacterized protein G2W53_032682 [Senna tora]|uniref:Uncharacterized protein n=1 Tax=Senna tora TaxID=362788 RepID=A0A834SXS2_9FABA|nr:uncharacterized protein G2W53_037346 [Senna tora]KAF7811706.1 uncharacterized protein G2W53_032682 [Senna tora]